MKRLILLGAFSMVLQFTRAQRLVFDRQHLTSVSQNSAMRSSAEAAHDSYLGKINHNINDLNANVSSVVLAQTMIYEGLSNVNSALKDGLAVKNMAFTIADMTGYINQALAIARTEPYLLLVASGVASEMRNRSMALVTDVSGFILKQGDNVLADYNSRDQLLRKVTQQLQILDGLAYGCWKAVFWAKERGIIATMTPFSAWISQDQLYVDQIIQQAKFLKQ